MCTLWPSDWAVPVPDSLGLGTFSGVPSVCRTRTVRACSLTSIPRILRPSFWNGCAARCGQARGDRTADVGMADCQESGGGGPRGPGHGLAAENSVAPSDGLAATSCGPEKRLSPVCLRRLRTPNRCPLESKTFWQAIPWRTTTRRCQRERGPALPLFEMIHGW
jgi:hypothetical protein